jgi:hypothetical protein
MALHWRPVGSEPASTYWQRRAVLATAAVLLLVLLTTMLGGSSDDRDTLTGAPVSPAPATSSPSALLAAPPTPSPSPAAVPACLPAALKIEALADQDSYPVGGSPRLSLRVTNTGSAPCTRDLGQAAVELLVVSGGDRIWSSDDCAPGGPTQVSTLVPGEPTPRASTWDGRRSLPGCSGGKAQAQPGTYRVQARVGDLRVEGEVFRITG